MKHSYDWNSGFNYGGNQYYGNDAAAQQYLDNIMKTEAAKRTIRSLGVYTGLALLGYIVFQNGLYILFELLGLMKNYTTNPVYQCAMDIVFTILGLFLPFVIFGTLATRRNKKYLKENGIPEFIDPMGLNKPKSTLDFILAVISGMGFCMLANLATSYITVFMSLFGFELSSPDINMPEGVTGIFINVLRVSIVAALTEELSLRGYVMGNLRYFGDKFAITAAAVVFAFMHGNLVQAPFALIAGFALGYFSIKTGSIWTGIAIHALNNLLSLVVTYSIDFLGEDLANTVYTYVIYALIIGGLICFFFFKKRTSDVGFYAPKIRLSQKGKYKAFFLNPAMLLALAYMIYVTSQYVTRG